MTDKTEKKNTVADTWDCFLLQFKQIHQHISPSVQQEPTEDGEHPQAVHRGAAEEYTGGQDTTHALQ